jgi:hypothetical protein
MEFVIVEKERLDDLIKSIQHLLIDTRYSVPVAYAARRLGITPQMAHYMISTGQLEAVEIELGSREGTGRKPRTIYYVLGDSLERELLRRGSGYVKRGRKSIKSEVKDALKLVDAALTYKKS